MGNRRCSSNPEISTSSQNKSQANQNKQKRVRSAPIRLAHFKNFFFKFLKRFFLGGVFLLTCSAIASPPPSSSSATPPPPPPPPAAAAPDCRKSPRRSSVATLPSESPSSRSNSCSRTWEMNGEKNLFYLHSEKKSSQQTGLGIRKVTLRNLVFFGGGGEGPPIKQNLGSPNSSS